MSVLALEYINQEKVLKGKVISVKWDKTMPEKYCTCAPGQPKDITNPVWIYTKD